MASKSGTLEELQSLREELSGRATSAKAEGGAIACNGRAARRRPEARRLGTGGRRRA